MICSARTHCRIRLTLRSFASTPLSTLHRTTPHSTTLHHTTLSLHVPPYFHNVRALLPSLTTYLTPLLFLFFSFFSSSFFSFFFSSSFFSSFFFSSSSPLLLLFLLLPCPPGRAVRARVPQRGSPGHPEERGGGAHRCTQVAGAGE